MNKGQKFYEVLIPKEIVAYAGAKLFIMEKGW